MKVKILEAKTLNELDSYWSNEDYSALLKEFDFPEADEVKDENLREMLFMAISDFEPDEAASIILTYKLSDQLNEGQIHSISHEMTNDKVAEEYPEPSLHYDLFNINQLLYKAYNGTFPNTEATLLKLEVVEDDGIEIGEDREILAKVIAGALKNRSLVKRLFADQLEASVKFEDAHKFIWTIKNPEKNKYHVLTSKYWISKEDIVGSDYDIEVKNFEEE
ncbi:hypothetical protein [Psychroflexus sediminis]|uniref:Uncharacterized protein n=1 Tax=Psychroflexus sediminis TaxID=470826 RepID=A0A1G7TVX4_9FLAO|nr:hypothetical protein [Psychroflexus sediminis]SDG38650.1 hypothetical protein SAMN04488027_10149 [Psychroflexus sediminis]